MKIARPRHAGQVFVLAIALLLASFSVQPAANAIGEQPTGLSPANSTAVTGIPDLSWDRMPDATGYDVQVSTGQDYATKLVDTTTTNIHYVPTVQLPSNTDVYWHVRAKYAGGLVSSWAEARFHSAVAKTPTPIAPADGAQLQPPEDVAMFRWSAVPGATQYNVQIGTDPQFTDPTSYSTTTVKSTSYLATQQQPPGDYYWRVRAEFGGGITSTWSDADSPAAKYTVLPLRKAALISPADDPDGGSPIQEVVLDWDAVPGAAKYDLQISTDQNFLSNTTTVPGITGTRYSPPTTLNNDQYYWRVRPVDASGNSPTWGADETVHSFRRNWPDQPTLEYPADGASVGDPFFFQWSPVHLASNYSLQISTNSSFSPSTSVWTCATTNTTYTPGAYSQTNCQPSSAGTYFWRVIAVDNPAAVVTQSINAAVHSFTYDPGLVTLDSPGSGATVTVPTMTWEPTANASKYRVTLTSVATGNTAASITTAATSFTPRTVLPAGTYRWQVQTVSEDGRVGASVLPQSQRQFTLADQPTPSASTPDPTSPDSTSARFPELTWTPVVNATRYLLYIRKAGTTAWSQVESGYAYPAGEDSGTNNLSPSGYEWYVAAYNGSAFLSQGSIGTFTIAPLGSVAGYRAALTGRALSDQGTSCQATVPAECQNLRQTPVLRWDADPEAGYYQLWISRDAELTNVITGYPVKAYSNIWTPTSQFSDSNAGSAYYWFVQSCTAGGTCMPLQAATHQFNMLSNKARLLPPTSGGSECPSDDTGTPVCADDVTLNWQDYLHTNSDVSGAGSTLPTAARTEAKSYRVQTSTSPQFTSLIDNLTADQTTFTSFSSTYPEGPIYWRVQAIDATGNPLSWSDTGTFTKRSPVPSLESPASNDVVPGTQPLSWAPLNYASSYNVEIYKNDDTVPSSANRVGFGNTKQASFAPSGPLAASSVNYRWRVQRVDAVGRVGAWSDLKLAPFTVAAPVPAVQGPVDGTTVAPNEGLFEWGAVDTATSYRFERRAVGSTALAESRSTPALAWAPTLTIPGGDWQWRVVAVDSAGHELGASEWRAFTVIAKPSSTAPIITGSGQVGTTLTSSAPSWNLPGLTTSYQWYRGATAIPGATASIYDLTAADLNQNMMVRVTGTKPGYPDGTADSNVIKCGLGTAPTLAQDLALTGTAKVGTVVSSNPVAWNQSGVTTGYQWLLDGSPISGATSPSYTVKNSDVSKKISLRVTGTRAGYSPGVYESNTLTASGNDPLVATTAPTVTGTPRLGQTLTTSPGTWPGSPTYSYQWLRDGTAIPGATAPRLVVAVADAGHRLSVRVTAHKVGYLDGTSTSASVLVARVTTTTRLTLAKTKIRRTAYPKSTITVSDSYGLKPTGTVQIYSGSTLVKKVTLLASQSGKVTVTFKRQSVGRHSIWAKYLGNTRLAPSRSGKVTLRVVR